MSVQLKYTALGEPDDPGSGSSAVVEYESLQVDEVLALLEASQVVAIAGHINPDGDAVGSALALRDLLRAMGKEVDILLGQDNPPPELYDFLPDYEFTLASEYIKTPDLFIVVDSATIKRLGTSERLLEEAENTLAIDHHTSFQGFTRYYYGNDVAPATASLIWQLIRASRIEPTPNMATYCYVGIMTDTGRFAFRSTDRSAFVDAMEMVDLGVNPSEMSQFVYENKSMAAMRLEALIINRIQFACEGTVVYSFILHDDLSTLGLKRDDTEQLPTILRSIKGVEIAMLFRDELEEGVRVNLRSRSSFNVGDFASVHGGGGHRGAAGLTLDLPLADAISYTLHHIVEDFSHCQ
ncbi:MAG: bifunctional oligoribonuclease/PAP phosphatase NrnA [Coriobacteriia bacterium]|nr:bifunctional oligoribonuclease/PAP phosphatase NrnA [Coriobacteriia bacterium]MCL2749933.1 bifunctional oligoribonuclease/PAP phosphatase NrnA [Coriobacteriia bacterium]